jgi:hypothetical protein
MAFNPADHAKPQEAQGVSHDLPHQTVGVSVMGWDTSGRQS